VHRTKFEPFCHLCAKNNKVGENLMKLWRK